MSLDIHWEKLTEPSTLKTTVGWLNAKLTQHLEAFPIISDLHIELIDLGTIPPEVSILDISDLQWPFLATAAQEPNNKSDNLQMTLHVSYDSPVFITLAGKLALNYPSPQFASLPLKLILRKIILLGKLILVRSGATMMLSIVMDDDARLEYDIETEIGDPTKHGKKFIISN